MDVTVSWKHVVTNVIAVYYKPCYVKNSASSNHATDDQPQSKWFGSPMIALSKNSFLPGHISFEQTSVLVSINVLEPSSRKQVSPAPWGEGVSHERDLDLTPPPQVTEQPDQNCHAPHPPSTEAG